MHLECNCFSFPYHSHLKDFWIQYALMWEHIQTFFMHKNFSFLHLCIFFFFFTQKWVLMLEIESELGTCCAYMIFSPSVSYYDTAASVSKWHKNKNHKIPTWRQTNLKHLSTMIEIKISSKGEEENWCEKVKRVYRIFEGGPREDP